MKTFSGVPGDSRCECSDNGCPVTHRSKSQGCGNLATTILYRVDMEDVTGTAFCADCADDAMQSGLFTDEIEDEDEDTETGIRCDQCSAVMINGVFCHETGCPNTHSRYDAESDTWIKQRKCFDCGCMVDADDPCCLGDNQDERFDAEMSEDV